MKTFAISDIHGCYDELVALVKKLPINPEVDRIVFLGDYVDRGPKVRQVINQLVIWKAEHPHWVMLQGNHEDLLLDALLYGGRVYHSYDLWYQQGGRETALSYMPEGLSAYERATVQVKDVINKAHLHWLASLPRYYEDDKYIYVHGGLRPGIKLEDQDPYELLWIRNTFIESGYDWGKKVIYGHTPNYNTDPKKNLQPLVQKNKIGIDTAAVYSANNKLTAVELPAEKFYQQERIYA